MIISIDFERVNYMGLMNKFSNQSHKIHWGGASALWDITRHKIIGIPVLDLLHETAQDSDLKKLIRSGTDMVAIPHIKELQEFLEKEQLAYPPMPSRHNIDDAQIGLAIAEILRLSLVLDNIAFMSVTRDGLRKLVWDIIEEDKRAFNKIVDLLYEKNWTENPPSAN